MPGQPDADAPPQPPPTTPPICSNGSPPGPSRTARPHGPPVAQGEWGRRKCGRRDVLYISGLCHACDLPPDAWSTSQCFPELGVQYVLAKPCVSGFWGGSVWGLFQAHWVFNALRGVRLSGASAGPLWDLSGASGVLPDPSKRGPSRTRPRRSGCGRSGLLEDTRSPATFW